MAAPDRPAHPAVWSTTVSAIVSGTPAAVPLGPAKLDRMSVRTMPDWVSTSGPLEPSPGNGPAVSSGISTQAAADPVSAAAAACVESPEETAGPFPGDGSNGPDVLTQSGI